MDARKVTLIATIAAIALVAVGIGYAYTAFTENSGNVVGSEYLVVTPQSDSTHQVYSDSFDKSIAYDTEKIDGYVKYSLTDDMLYKVGGVVTKLSYSSTDREVIEIGELYLVIDQTESNATTYDFNVKAGAGIDNTNFGYVFKLQTSTDDVIGTAMSEADAASTVDTNLKFVDYDPTNGVSWTGLSNNKAADDYRVVKVTIFVCLKNSDEVSVADNDMPLPKQVLDGVSFTFKVTAANPTS